MNLSLTWLIPTVVGVILLLGIIFKWKFLIDPPEELSSLYSYAWIKKTFGRRVLIFVNWFVAVGMIIIGLLFMIVTFKGNN